MLLAALDAGNTRTHAALFAPASYGVALVEWRPSIDLSAAAFRRWRAPVAEVAYASVNPAADSRIERAVRVGWGLPAKKLGGHFPAAIRNRTRAPKRTGADRLANAVAAWHRCRRACVVIDLGTAVNFDVVDARGDFIGGAIAPGRRLQADALHGETGLLPRIDPRARLRPGRDTRETIGAGVTWGIAGLVREGVTRIARELGTRPRVFGTGGDVSFLPRDLFDDVVPHLTLEGIALSYLAWTRKRSR